MLVHNIYGQAAPCERSASRFACSLRDWTYDLNFTIAYLGAGSGSVLVDWRGGGGLGGRGRARATKETAGDPASRGRHLQSLSLLAIAAILP